VNELELVTRIRQKAEPGARRRMLLGIGDDCAIYRPAPGEDLVFTTDFLIEDVHFRRSTHSAADAGHKALARGLSDIAAMGATPRFCLVSLAVDAGAADEWVDAFYDGLLALAAEHKTALAGGDLARSAGPVTCDIVVCGSVPQGEALRRDGARPGDQIYVSGALGGSALGLEKGKGEAWKRHLRPDPRIKLGQALRGKATSCMDLSDGLSLDLHRLCSASNVSAELDGDLPVFEGASIPQALHGGEDYELLFTAPPAVKVPKTVAGVPITRIGVIRRGNAGRIKLDDFELLPLGYDHFSPSRKP
jgi:thiamine-monophosphate kinase